MNLKTQKRICGQILKIGKTRVWFDKNRLDEIKEAITRADLRSLIKDLAIQKKPEIGNSRYRVRKIKKLKKLGRRKGLGSRKGKKTARTPTKQVWINKIRNQREFITILKEKELIDIKTYRLLYRRTKGGFFRSKRHIKLFLEDKKLIKQKKQDGKK